MGLRLLISAIDCALTNIGTDGFSCSKRWLVCSLRQLCEYGESICPRGLFISHVVGCQDAKVCKTTSWQPGCRALAPKLETCLSMPVLFEGMSGMHRF
jgi:hypothetical protein